MTFDTLHMCNINDPVNISENLELYLTLIEKNDAVVFYSKELGQSHYNKLIHRIHSDRVYFIIDDNIHNLKTISYDDWLDMVNLYKKTFTWK